MRAAGVAGPDAGGALFGAVESGGTKVVCLLGRGPGDVSEEASFPTGRPGDVLDAIVDFFRQAQQRHGNIAALGFASFGPVDLDEDSPRYGHVTRTPKAGWSSVDVVGPLSSALGVPVAFDTDVNGAGIGEYEWGAGRGLDNFVYVTVGSGIGAGIIIDGRPLHGVSHPEIGHIRPPRSVQEDPFPGICPFHGDCLEGLASGAAIVARWGKTLEELEPSDQPLRLEAGYLAHLCTELTYMVSPHRIIIGGGVATCAGLLEAVREQTVRRLSGYLSGPLYQGSLEDYIVRPELGQRAGVLGAVALARRLAGTNAVPALSHGNPGPA